MCATARPSTRSFIRVNPHPNRSFIRRKINALVPLQQSTTTFSGRNDSESNTRAKSSSYASIAVSTTVNFPNRFHSSYRNLRKW